MAKKEKKPKGEKPAGEEPASKKGGMLGSIATLGALGAASFGTVFMLPSNTSIPDANHTESSGHDTKVADFDFTEKTTYLELAPLAISLQEQSRILRIGITLEMRAGEEAYINPNDPKIRDAFMGYLRALRLEQIEDAAFMAQMRAQLLRRAQLIFGAENIRGILITDFLVR